MQATRQKIPAAAGSRGLLGHLLGILLVRERSPLSAAPPLAPRRLRPWRLFRDAFGQLAGVLQRQLPEGWPAAAEEGGDVAATRGGALCCGVRCGPLCRLPLERNGLCSPQRLVATAGAAAPAAAAFFRRHRRREPRDGVQRRGRRAARRRPRLRPAELTPSGSRRSRSRGLPALGRQRLPRRVAAPAAVRPAFEHRDRAAPGDGARGGLLRRDRHHGGPAECMARLPLRLGRHLLLLASVLSGRAEPRQQLQGPQRAACEHVERRRLR